MDKNNIKYIFIILTPFQLRTMEYLFKDILYEDSSIVYYSEYVGIIEKNKGFYKKFRTIDISLNRILNFDVTYILKIRKEIKNVKKDLNCLIEEFTLNRDLNIIIGSDKDLFTQILLNSLFKSKYKIILSAVDEGLGYYKLGGDLGEKLKKIIYRLLTPIVFNEKINYVFTLGLDRRINIIYARLIDKLPYKNENVIYKRINTIHSDIPKHTSKSKEILIFSFPSTDYNLNDNDKNEILENVVGFFPEDYVFKVKPHPREKVSNYMESIFGINNIFNLHTPGEDGIDYFMYEYIVHFSSSMIIDMISQGYPADRIISISFNNSRVDNLFINTICVSLNELNSFKIKNLHK